jgi:hypothetical protein
MCSKDCGNTKRKHVSLSMKQKDKIQNPENPEIHEALVPRLSE